MTTSIRTPQPVEPIDVINYDCIRQSELVVDRNGRRRYEISGGGYFARSIYGWSFSVYGVVTTVTVPSTIAALEQRDALAVAA